MAENKSKISVGMICLRQLFGHDLKKIIDDEIIKGNQVVISGDFNSNYDQLKEWMLNIRLKDLMHENHGRSHITYQRQQ